MTMQSDLGEHASQVKVAADTTKEQFHSLMDQGRGEWQQMMGDRSRQAAEGLRRLGDQLGKLSNGRADEAPRLQQYLDDAQQRVASWAGRLEAGGFDGVMRDVQQFARRRPGMFLLGAAGTGFLVGRAFKVGASANTGNGSTGADAVGADPWASYGGSVGASSTRTQVGVEPAGFQNGAQGSGSGGWPAGAGVVR